MSLIAVLQRRAGQSASGTAPHDMQTCRAAAPAACNSKCPTLCPAPAARVCPAQASLDNLLLFARMTPDVKAKVVSHTWVRQVAAGDILIQEGETGLAATELYVVKEGTFEVGLCAGVSGCAAAGGIARARPVCVCE